MSVENLKARIPAGAAFHEAWDQGETPHLIRSTRFSVDFGKTREIYNLFGAEQDRSLDEHQQKLGLDLDEIPLGGRMLVIGSGVARRFEREVKQERPDLKVFSIDLLLKYGVQERIREAIRMGATPISPGIDRNGYRVKFPHEIMGEHSFYRPGAVAAAIAAEGEDTEGLPFADGSFNSVVALHSVPQYSRIEEVPFVLTEVARVMQIGAIARFYPFFPVDLPALETPEFRQSVLRPVVTEMPKGFQFYLSDWRPDHRRVVFQKKGKFKRRPDPTI